MHIMCPTCGHRVAHLFIDDDGDICFEHIPETAEQRFRRTKGESWADLELRFDGPLPSSDWYHCYCRRNACVDFTIDNAEATALVRRLAKQPRIKPYRWNPRPLRRPWS